MAATAAAKPKRVPSGPMPPRRDPSPTMNMDGAPTGDPMLAMQLMLAASNALAYIDVDIYGQTIRFHYKPLSFTAQNECVSKALGARRVRNPETGKMETDGEMRFDVYFREALRKMIVNPPFPLTDTVINAFPRSVGIAFGEIIPPVTDFAEQLTSEGNEQGLSSNPEQA